MQEHSCDPSFRGVEHEQSGITAVPVRVCYEEESGILGDRGGVMYDVVERADSFHVSVLEDGHMQVICLCNTVEIVLADSVQHHSFCVFQA